MTKHFTDLKKTCIIRLDNVELTEEIKKYVLKNRRIDFRFIPRPNATPRPYNVSILNATTVLSEQRTEGVVTFLTPTFKKTCDRNELFFQRIVETFLGGSHMTLSCGTTDVTTETTHAEIKRWPEWKSALGQIQSYNVACPRPRLHVYMFDNASNRTRREAIQTFHKCGIAAFTFEMTTSVVEIVDAIRGNVVFTCQLVWQDA